MQTEHYDKHYQTDIQPIEYIQAVFTPEELIGFLKGNIIKYISRLGKKDDEQKETAKILRYAEWLHQVACKKKINPRQ